MIGGTRFVSGADEKEEEAKAKERSVCMHGWLVGTGLSEKFTRCGATATEPRINFCFRVSVVDGEAQLFF